jgi:Fe-S-cluster containining protein
MVENPAVMVLSETGEINNNNSCDVETIGFDIDILGERIHFDVRIAQKQARLSDITPLARMLSTKLTLMVWERLHKNGKSVPCCKGCSACCNYLVPLSIPEVFRLREEVLDMPADQGRAILESCLDTAKRILDQKPKEFNINKPAEAECQIQLSQIGKWYAGLKLACPFLSNRLCTIYRHRPVACREYMVTGSALSCETGLADDPHVVRMPIRVLECLGQLAAELERSDIEAVMLPLALPWAQENLERAEQTWPATAMVERFIDILRSRSIEQLKPKVAKILQPKLLETP